ncbi:MAG: peptidylprolyl isomerase [Bryobacterales bacterium]|nr:peptidylprolyl isomerase [Bryobacterales bacterium]
MVLRFLTGAAVVLGTALAGDVRIVEEIVAKVNGDIITRSELERERQYLEMALKQQGLTANQLQEAIRQREKDILKDRIDQLLLVQKGKELGISVESEVTKRLAEIQLEQKIADPDKFQAWIREQAGQPYEDFRAQMRDSMLTRRVIGQEVGSRINVPQSEIEKYYQEHKNDFIREEQVFLREILVSTEGKKPEEAAAAEKKAKDLVARARKGEKFHELARDNSDALTARNYGEMGTFKRGELRKEIEEIVFKAEKGYVTDPIRVPNGFVILKVEERFAPGLAPLEQVENEIRERLYMPRMEPRLKEYMTRLRVDAFLEIRDGYVDTGAAPGKDTRWKDPAQLRPETTTKEEVAASRRRKLLWVVPWFGQKTVEPEVDTRSLGMGREREAEQKEEAAPAVPAPAATPAGKPQ